MSRRSGQCGYIEKKGDTWYVRFWLDVPGQEKRVHKCARLCPADGPGKLTKPERERRAREIIAESGADSEEHFNTVQGINLGVTFRQQSKWWLEYMQTRRRKPIRPATASAWQDCLENWLNPTLGDMPLSDVNNLAVKELVSKMANAGLSAKTINNYVQVVKMVVASALDEQGGEIYPRKWNHDFIDLPLVKNQRRPTFTREEVSSLVAAAKGRYQTLYALLAGSGLRIGEALGLRVEHISEDRTTIEIQQSVFDRQVQLTKTPNGVRSVDLHSSLATMLGDFIGDRKTGFLFCTQSRRPMSDDNVYRRLNPLLKRLGMAKRGFHAFRRFRTTWLRRNRVPVDLIRFWIGHANRSVTDGYSRLRDDVPFRRECAEGIGLGFELLGRLQEARKSGAEWQANCSFVPNVPKAPVVEVAVAQ